MTPQEQRSLQNLLSHDKTIADVYAFLHSTLDKDSKYNPSDKELSKRLIAVLNSLSLQEKEDLVAGARKLVNQQQH